MKPWFRQATVLLATSRRFDKVIGLDPSEGMIAAARSTLEKDPSSVLREAKNGSASKLCDVEYRSGSAEDLGWLDDNSIDLVTAGMQVVYNLESDSNMILQVKLHTGLITSVSIESSCAYSSQAGR